MGHLIGGPFRFGQIQTGLWKVSARQIVEIEMRLSRSRHRTATGSLQTNGRWGNFSAPRVNQRRPANIFGWSGVVSFTVIPLRPSERLGLFQGLLADRYDMLAPREGPRILGR